MSKITFKCLDKSENIINYTTTKSSFVYPSSDINHPKYLSSKTDKSETDKNMTCEISNEDKLKLSSIQLTKNKISSQIREKFLTKENESDSNKKVLIKTRNLQIIRKSLRNSTSDVKSSLSYLNNKRSPVNNDSYINLHINNLDNKKRNFNTNIEISTHQALDKLNKEHKKLKMQLLFQKKKMKGKLFKIISESLIENREKISEFVNRLLN
jgi:hypothetical protein